MRYCCGAISKNALHKSYEAFVKKKKKKGRFANSASVVCEQSQTELYLFDGVYKKKVSLCFVKM